MGLGIQIAATFIAVLLVMFILWLAYKGFKKVIPNAKFRFKYGMFGKKLKDEEIEFLQDCLKDEVSNADILCVMLLHDPTSEDRANAMIYIYDKMKKEVKKHE